MLQDIEHAIMVANLGFNPMNNGESIIINVPPLTEERRRELAKQAKSETEDAKISIRGARKDANNELKKMSDISEDLKKNTEADIQQMTDTHITKSDALFPQKKKKFLRFNSSFYHLINLTFFKKAALNYAYKSVGFLYL